MSEYIIGSFNMFKFSRQGNSESKKSYELIAKIFQDAKFDIVALQEVFQKEAVADLVAVLNKETNGKWDYSWDEPKKTSNKQAREGYAFVWNTLRLDKVHTILSDGSVRVFEPRIINQYKKSIIRIGKKDLLRNPYYGRFAPKNARGESYGFELRLINTHIMYKKSKEDSFLEELKDIAMRKTEYAILSQIVFPKLDVKDDNSGVKTHLHAYTILMGDYNLSIKTEDNPSPYIPESYEMGENFITYLPKDSEIVTIQDEKTSLIRLPENPEDDAIISQMEGYYSKNYDHFTLNKKKLQKYNTAYDAHRVNVIANSQKGINVSVSKEFNGDFRKYYNKVSDHLPVRLKLEIEPRRRRNT